MNTRSKINFFGKCQTIAPVILAMGLVFGLFLVLFGFLMGFEDNSLYSKRENTKELCLSVFNSTLCGEVQAKLEYGYTEAFVTVACVSSCQRDEFCNGLCERIFKNYVSPGNSRSPWKHPLSLIGLFLNFLALISIPLNNYASEQIKILTVLLDEEEGRTHKNY